MKANQTKIIDMVSNATAKAEVITKYETETKLQKNTILASATKLVGLEKKAAKILTESNDHVKQTNDVLSRMTEVEEKNILQQKSIAQTLTMASKYGMAASFKERKDELKTPMVFWAIVFISAMGGLFFTGINYILPKFQGGSIPSTTDILIEISLIAPLIWLGWMSAKQYGFTSRIREDYSFKYASALAFEGYKKEAAEVNKEGR